jgi:ElaB/YqjD/DUF883 family membrane-anchored ribosome-binding protein
MSDFSSAKDNAKDALDRGKEGMVNAANTFASNASSDLDSLRRDLNSLKDTVSKFVSQAGDVSSSVAAQVGSAASNAASSLAESGANMASAAKDQVKTLTSELEDMSRRNPLGTIAAAVIVGVVIGLIGRSRSR